ncbi:MAG: TOBE domain-containing protein [Dethiobacteria bacterium]
MQISSRNKLTGNVVQVTPGAVNAEVILDIGGGNQIVGVITRHSQEKMQIREGDRITALIKASSVMFMK